MVRLIDCYGTIQINLIETGNPRCHVDCQISSSLLCPENREKTINGKNVVSLYEKCSWIIVPGG